MKKGMLTTLSALPAEDTENHHHTTIKKGEGENTPVLSPQDPSDCFTVCWSTYGEGHGLWLQERLLIHKEGLPTTVSSLAKSVESLLLEYYNE